MSDKYIYFNSGAKAPYNQLSNFYSCQVKWNGYVFPSSEHVYQWIMVKNEKKGTKPDDWVVGGKYSKFEALKEFFNKKENAEKSIAYWKKRNAIGIVAKMAANKLRTRKVGDMTSEQKTWLEYLWLHILEAKMENNPLIREVLLGTGEKILVEYSRIIHTKPKEMWDKNPWVGHVHRFNGKTYGYNIMGVFMMQVRGKLSKPRNHGWPWHPTATEPAEPYSKNLLKTKRSSTESKSEKNRKKKVKFNATIFYITEDIEIIDLS